MSGSTTNVDKRGGTKFPKTYLEWYHFKAASDCKAGELQDTFWLPLGKCTFVQIKPNIKCVSFPNFFRPEMNQSFATTIQRRDIYKNSWIWHIRLWLARNMRECQLCWSRNVPVWPPKRSAWLLILLVLNDSDSTAVENKHHIEFEWEKCLVWNWNTTKNADS